MKFCLLFSQKEKEFHHIYLSTDLPVCWILGCSVPAGFLKQSMETEGAGLYCHSPFYPITLRTVSELQPGHCKISPFLMVFTGCTQKPLNPPPESDQPETAALTFP